MDPSGKVLIVDKELQTPAGTSALFSWLGIPRAKDYTSNLSCYDLSGRQLIRVRSRGANRFSTEISPDGRLLAVSPPVEDGTINLYDIPSRTPGGIVLGLMTVEVGLALGWTAWRRRRRRRLMLH
jgi:Tol biopolymer transport system component